MSRLSVAVMKLPDIREFLEESFALAHSFRDSVPPDRFHPSFSQGAQGVAERNWPYSIRARSREVELP